MERTGSVVGCRLSLVVLPAGLGGLAVVGTRQTEAAAGRYGHRRHVGHVRLDTLLRQQRLE